MASFAELKELRLRVMELETQTQLALNQLKRQTATVAGLNTEVDTKNRRIREQQVGTQSFHNIQKGTIKKPPNRFLNVKAATVPVLTLLRVSGPDRGVRAEAD